MHVYPSRRRLSLMMLGALGLAVASALIASGVIEADSTFLAVSYAGVGFFGVCALYMLWRLAAPKPSVIISERGIYDNASLTSAGWIGWDEIESLEISELGQQRFLTIFPRDAWEVMARQNALKRYLMLLNMDRFFGSPINIPQITVRMPLEELRLEILRIRQEVQRTATETTELEAPGETPETPHASQDGPETADEQSRSAAEGSREGTRRLWWRRMLGG